MKTGSLPFHYGWIIALSGLLTLLVALGLGRFALGMLLPSMASTLGLSYAQMGFISTGNFVGYLVAVLLCSHAVKRYGTCQTITTALLLVGLSLLSISWAKGFWQVLLWYTLTGVGSGAANVPIMGLVSHWFAPRWRGKAAGLIVTGNGLGIMFTGLSIPLINTWRGSEGWRTSWLAFGLIALVTALAVRVLVRDSPQALGMSPMGSDLELTTPAFSGTPLGYSTPGIVRHFGSIYFLFGFSYAIYVTFIVTTLVKEQGFSEAAAGSFWFWLGFLSLFSGPLFGALSDHLGRKTGLIMVFTLQGLAYTMVAVPLADTLLYLSIGLFGFCAWSIPTIMAAAMGDYMGPQGAVKALGTVTFYFGIGQIAGPSLAGLWAQTSGSFASSYLLAAVLAAAAVLLTALLGKPFTLKLR
jgi:MFS family permease